ncbi:alpha/beta fold hydrolase [Pedobacter sp.]|uniref:alpha/beta fold hydrolase n=1 Tax=Pedobacter sp. TaxID=1411316 RepID=UPI003C65F9E9
MKSFRNSCLKIFVPLIYLTTINQAIAQKIESAELNGHLVFYEIKGKGLPIFVLAGGPGLNPAYMTPLVDELSKSYQCILVNQQGTGKTRFRKSEINYIDEFSDDIYRLKNYLGYNQVSVLGHSWGGMLAMNLACRYPKEIENLILVASGGYNLGFLGYFQDNIFSNLSDADQRLISHQQELRKSSNAFSKSNEKCLSQTELTNVMVKGYFFDKAHASVASLKPGDLNEDAASEVWKSLSQNDWDLKDRLKLLKVRTLIIQGRQDPMDLQTANAIHAAIAHSSLQIIESCGHFPWIEKGDTFYACIRNFLRF